MLIPDDSDESSKNTFSITDKKKIHLVYRQKKNTFSI